MPIPTLSGITAKTITTARLTTRVLFSGSDDAIPVLLLHGNHSSATFWEDVMLALPPGYRGIAPDQRGYGDADRSKVIDATRGMGDFADDAVALLDALGIDKAHVVGHSAGGCVMWRMMSDYPQRILTVTVVCPGSPYGFGGTKDLNGTLCYADGAGSGGGLINPAFAQAIADGDRSSDSPLSPRNVMNNSYWKPPFIPSRVEDLLSSMLSVHTGEKRYPGDVAASPNWPHIAPGKFGLNNALSPLYMGDVTRLYSISPKPPVLWVRGSDDRAVSDSAASDPGTLGAMGLIPGYPGADVFPSQPMIGQIRAVLERYQQAGGRYTEVVIANTAHTPYIEKPGEFNRVFHEQIR